MIPLINIIMMGFVVVVGAGLIIGTPLYARNKNHIKFTNFLVGMVPYMFSHMVGYLFQYKLISVEPFQSMAANSAELFNLFVVLLKSAVAVFGLWMVFRLFVGYELLDEPYAFSVGSGFAAYQALIELFSFIMDHFTIALEINYGNIDTSQYSEEALKEWENLLQTFTSRNPVEYFLVGIGYAAFFAIALATAYAVMYGMWTGKRTVYGYAFIGQFVFSFAYYLLNLKFGFYAERIFAILVGAGAVFLIWKLKKLLYTTPQFIPPEKPSKKAVKK